MRNTLLTSITSVLLAVAVSAGVAAAADGTIDNSALSKSEFRDHARTFGLVYTLPKNVNDVLDSTIRGPLKEKLLNAKLDTEAQMFNIPHVTVVHVHSADPATPEKMLAAMPKLPPVLTVKLKTFYTTEAAKGAGRPWWFDLGVVKEGKSFDDMMAFNTTATAALTPLRDGPLPRCTGPVYAAMGDAAKDLVRTVGVSGVNVVKDGKELRSHNPHTTLVYSMAKFTPELQAQMNQAAKEFNQILPDGVDATFKTVSIVELGFAGNVLREVYRISLEDGSVTNVATGKTASLK
ncbi:hypothetical protein I8G32_00376 [Rhodopseudomonas palustris]|uniref:Uncharacterized protein n=1 Tax=Rhodopseudomonas palustris (strain ATCC BAA-98 / CGA009) TaxID=258594 RepID=Q6NCV8_RHOPA|nr:hypothetical protein [Rhodopseudomonas palustris]OPF93244.1 hypothetical protein B1S06_12680 [Rhodopseudomonas palustris]QQM01858.1 hypothetical protein I8G32_00376 [Rhodopseudomonas palustris]RJF64655.1 hypothetical protein D4Q71_10980 [Rhodopseudomonas palustris]WAB78074.1 hypothetical protein OR798_01870 [Rhodopseudomonas palustris]WCL90490.1 hypothetical protein TX73_001870 [Rhodopseudomonas palustris CGA009]